MVVLFVVQIALGVISAVFAYVITAMALTTRQMAVLKKLAVIKAACLAKNGAAVFAI